MDLHVENVYVDFYALKGGLYINADCNYPEASIQNTIFMTNVTAENSKERIAPYESGLLYYSGPGNVTVQNTNIIIYGTLSNDEPQLEVQLSDN